MKNLVAVRLNSMMHSVLVLPIRQRFFQRVSLSLGGRKGPSTSMGCDEERILSIRGSYSNLDTDTECWRLLPFYLLFICCSTVSSESKEVYELSN